MGLGGYLLWTAVAREISHRSNAICLPYEALDNGMIRVIKDEIFVNNPNFTYDVTNIFPLQLNNPHTNYCKLDTPARAHHRYDKHVIAQICEYYGIDDPKLKCDLFLTHEEIGIATNLIGIKSKPLIVIEPHTKDSYSVNKRYPFGKWQNVVNILKDRYDFIQVGAQGNKVLDNVKDLTGQTTFRECAAVIAEADLFLGAEGGLMHAANAVGIKSVIIVTGFLHPRMTCYPGNMNIWIGKNHGPCGMKIKCDKCSLECIQHDENEIIEIIKGTL